MKGCLHVSARILAFLVAALFVVSLPLSLVAFNLGRIAFSPERMTSLLTETIAETGGLRRLLMDSLAAPAETPAEGVDLASAMSFLTPQERDFLGEQLTPPGWVEEQTGVLVAAVYEWIDNDRARPEFVVDITPIKVALLAGGAADLVEVVVDSWPPCTVREMAEMSVGALFGQEDLVLCEPPEPLRSGLVGILNVGVAASLRALPDQLALGESGAADPAPAELMQAKERIRLVRFVAGWSWLLSPAMLGLILALVVRSWRSWAVWWGAPLILGAVVTGLTMVGVQVVVDEAIRGMLADASMPTWIGNVFRGLTTAMLAVTFRRVALQALLLLAAGIVVWVVGSIMARRRKTASAAPSTAAALPAQAGTVKLPPEPEPEEDDDTPRPSGMFG